MSPAERLQLIDRRAELKYLIAKEDISMRPFRIRKEGFQAELQEIEALFLAEENAA